MCGHGHLRRLKFIICRRNKIHSRQAGRIMMAGTFKYVTCDVCNTVSFPKREKTVQTNTSFVESMLCSPVFYDVMDCPACGCQITLQVRKVVMYEFNNEEMAE